MYKSLETARGTLLLVAALALFAVMPLRSHAALLGSACINPSNLFPIQVDCGTYLGTSNGSIAATLTIVGNVYTELARYRSTGSPKWIGEPGFGVTFTPATGDKAEGAGTWTAPYRIMFIAIDGPGAYHLYALGSPLGGGLYSGASSGLWATAPLSTSTSRGNESGRNLSNLAFFGAAPLPPQATPTAVPEPGPLGLLALGMLVLGAGRYGWKRVQTAAR